MNDSKLQKRHRKKRREEEEAKKKSLTRKVARSGDTRGSKHAAFDYLCQRCISCLWKTPQLRKDDRSTE